MSQSQTRKHCTRCGTAYDVPRYSETCPHRYASLQRRLDAGEKIPKATQRYEDNPSWTHRVSRNGDRA
jgi:hypothetical protein